jgi:hypothetical protein
MASEARLAAKRAEYADRAANARIRVTTRVNPALAALPQMLEMTAADLRLIAEQVDTRFRVMMSSLYESEGASGGQRWRELSPGYLIQKRAKWGFIKAGRRGLLQEVRELPARYRSGLFRLTLGEFKILQLTRRLRLSLTSKGPDHILEAGDVGPNAYIVLGTRVDYAERHWSGEGLPVRNPIQRTRAQDIELGRVALDAIRGIAAQRVRLLARAS